MQRATGRPSPSLEHQQRSSVEPEPEPERQPQQPQQDYQPQAMAPSSGARSGAQAAAAKAMYPNEDISQIMRTGTASNRQSMLPRVPHESDLSQDLQHLTMSEAAGAEPYSEDVADRNIARRKPRMPEVRQPTGQQSTAMGAEGSVKPLVSGGPRYSEDVADWNIVRNQTPPAGGARHVPAPLNFSKRRSVGSRPESRDSPVSPITPISGRSLTRKNDHSDLRYSSESLRVSSEGDRHSKSIKRSSLDKQLPVAPSDEYGGELHREQATSNELPEVHSALGKERGYLVKDAKAPVDLTGIVDLRNTEHTTLHERWAPAVVHETIREDVHHIREEQITREIHQDHIFHRVLPIVDIQVLPARHFVPVTGGYAEIAEEELPGRTGPNAQWVIAEMVSKGLPQSKGPVVPQQFTARNFEGTDGDSKEYMTPEGFKRTEDYWVHPPTIETGGERSGQTYPFYMGFPNAKDNGLRAKMPGGDCIGVSPLLAQKQRGRLQAQQEGAAMESNSEAPPPVPKHRKFPTGVVDSTRAAPSPKHFL